MQLQIQKIISRRRIMLSLILLSLFVAGFDFAAPANAQKEKPKEKTPEPQKKQGDAGTELDAANKPEQAMSLKLNTTHKGFLAAPGDKEDYYKIQVKKDSLLTINVSNDRGSREVLFLEVLYADGKLLEAAYDATADPGPGEAEQITIDKAPAATLLLRVRNQKGTQTYTLNIVGKTE